MPQLTLDLDRRERSAARVDDQLAALAVSPTRRAVIWLMLCHPRSIAADGRPGELCVALSYRQAGEWLVEHAERFAGMKLDKSNIGRAVKSWAGLGVITAHSQSGRPTLLAISIERLVAWHDAESEATERALDAWRSPVTGGDQPLQTVTGRDRGLPAVTASEREERERNNNPSLNSVAVTSGHGRSIPALPDGVENVAEGKAMRALILEWWKAHNMKAAGFDAVEVVGAILAARANGPGDWRAYINTCIANGVRSDYRSKARKLIDSASASPESRPYSPHGVPQ